MVEPRLGARLEAVERAADAAARAIMAVYATDFAVTTKHDDSPVTEADHAADAVLRERLVAIEPVPVISEETRPPPFEERRAFTRLWLVDPLDGTRGFVSRTGDFAVSVALVESGRPVLGVVLAPVSRRCYLAEDGRGAFVREDDGSVRAIHTRRPATSPLVVATSRSRRNVRARAFVESLGEVRVLRVGSAIKSCLVATGEADVYPGFSPTSEWDTAAAQSIVEQAGGALLDTALCPLTYNCRCELTNPPFLAVGDPEFDWSAHVPPASG